MHLLELKYLIFDYDKKYLKRDLFKTQTTKQNQDLKMQTPVEDIIKIV